MASGRDGRRGTTGRRRRWRRGRLAILGGTGVGAGLAIGLVGLLAGAEAGATAPATGLTPVALAIDPPRAEPELAAFLDRWCLGCHAGKEPEADLDLDPMLRQVQAGTPAASTVEAIERSRMLRHVRRRLADGSMPPSRRRPDEAAYRAAIDAADRLLASLAAWAGAPAASEAARHGVRNAPVRRLTRSEYATVIRDLLGVDFDPAGLPSEEIGHGFDTNGGTLSLSPLRFEQYVDAAERIAREAVVDAGAARERRRRAAGELERRGGGRVDDDAVVLYSAGAAVARFDVAAAGRYRVVAAVAGDQAGPELVRMQLRDLGGGGNGRTLAEMEVEGQWEPARLETTVDLPEGTFTVGAAFVNDYYQADAPDPAQRDRNAAVAWIELDGPLSPPEPTPLQRALAARFGGERADAWRPAVVHLAERAWRRPLDGDDAAALLDAVDAAAEAERAVAGGRASAASPMIDPLRLRIGITAILAHPRFLFRLEADPAPGESMRRLDGYELAARLAQLTWSSVPDAALAADAEAGRLASSDGRRAAVDRLLADPRSLALSEHFAAQWLRIRALADRRPDAERFPGVDADLREAMRMETVLFFDAMLREDRPVSHLVAADETFVNEPLARHYGIPGVRGPHMRRVALDGMRRGLVVDAATGGDGGGDGAAARGLGVLRHASILLTTSNPTRTSPVMRGKWVLESLLDDPPPPAPAFVPALARNGEPSEHETLRDLLEQHRADPTCAACHRRMDPLGFALEPFDAVGRPRHAVDGTPVDASAELPDGTRFDGPAGLRDLLLGARRPDLVRSLLRHLATYALGRGLDPADDLWLEPALAGLGADPTVRELLLAVVESPPFLHRFTPPRDDA